MGVVGPPPFLTFSTPLLDATAAAAEDAEVA